LVQVVNSQASVYALQGNQWQERGQGGQLMLYYYANAPHDLLVRWWKSGQSLAYQLVHGKLKPKGERSWVLRAYNMSYNPPREEIIALRFHLEEASQVFSNHYKQVSSHVIIQKSKLSNIDVESNDPEDEVGNGKIPEPIHLPDKSPVNRPPQTLPPPPPPRSPVSRPSPVKQLPQKPLPAQENVAKWACPMCTYMNPLLALTCEVCNKPKPASPTSPKGSWSCGECTFQNGPSDTQCNICGAKPGADPEVNPGPPPVKPKDNLRNDSKPFQPLVVEEDDEELLQGGGKGGNGGGGEAGDFGVIQRMIAAENDKKNRVEEANRVKSLKQREEELEREKASLAEQLEKERKEKERLLREQQSRERKEREDKDRKEREDTERRERQ